MNKPSGFARMCVCAYVRQYVCGRLLLSICRQHEIPPYQRRADNEAQTTGGMVRLSLCVLRTQRKISAESEGAAMGIKPGNRSGIELQLYHVPRGRRRKVPKKKKKKVAIQSYTTYSGVVVDKV